MPLVTITVQKPKTIDFKSKVLSAIHEALVSVGVPSADRFQRVIELDMDDFRFDPLYPDAATPRNSDFVLVEILWSVGRSVKVKKAFLGKPWSCSPNQGSTQRTSWSASRKQVGKTGLSREDVKSMCSQRVRPASNYNGFVWAFR